MCVCGGVWGWGLGEGGWRKGRAGEGIDGGMAMMGGGKGEGESEVIESGKGCRRKGGR